MESKGMMGFVYRAADSTDCTNGGVSGSRRYLVLLGEGIPGIFAPKEDMPGVVLKTMRLGSEEYAYCEPTVPVEPGNVGWMFGGNFLYCSDSRWPTKSPIPIHDRQETMHQYEILSR